MRIEVDDHGAAVTLSRPDKHHAVDAGCSRASSLPPPRRHDAGVRAVARRGEG
jgi:hypothetical protein